MSFDFSRHPSRDPHGIYIRLDYVSVLYQGSSIYFECSRTIDTLICKLFWPSSYCLYYPINSIRYWLCVCRYLSKSCILRRDTGYAAQHSVLGTWYAWYCSTLSFRYSILAIMDNKSVVGNPNLVLQGNNTSALSPQYTGNTEYVNDFGEFPVMCPHHSNTSNSEVKIKQWNGRVSSPRRVWRKNYSVVKSPFRTKKRWRCCYLAARENEQIERLMWWVVAF